MAALTEKRQYPREQVLIAVAFVPNGHRVVALDLSLGGARLGLLDYWRPSQGCTLPVSFLSDSDETIVLRCRVIRVDFDNAGVQFEPGQEEEVERLLEAARLPGS